MATKETENWTFHHLGLIVHDLEKTVAYFKSLGIVEFPPPLPKPTSTGPVWKEMMAFGEILLKDGKPTTPRNPDAKPGGLQFCRLETITYEIIQPTKNSGIREFNGDFLEKNGEGISHIAYGVAPEHFDEEVEKMLAKGIEIVQSGKQMENRGQYAYFDTREGGGIATELMEVRSRS